MGQRGRGGMYVGGLKHCDSQVLLKIRTYVGEDIKIYYKDSYTTLQGQGGSVLTVGAVSGPTYPIGAL